MRESRRDKDKDKDKVITNGSLNSIPSFPPLARAEAKE